MKLKVLIALPFIAGTTTAYAADGQNRTESDQEWTVGISGGITTIERASDQTFGSMSLTKDFGDSFVGIDVSYVDSGNVPGLIENIPASTTQLTLSAGTSFNSLSADGYVSLGKRHFDIENLSRNNRAVNIDSNGSAFGTGISLSYDFVAGEQLFITPILSVDYNELDIARVANLPNGQQVGIENSENGVTGTFGIAAQRLFGKNDMHLISFLGNIVTTSNTTSFNPGNSQSAVLRVLAQREEPGQKDSWGELGASLSIQLQTGLRMDMSIIQTLGFLNSDATSVSGGLRYSF